MIITLVRTKRDCESWSIIIQMGFNLYTR